MLRSSGRARRLGRRARGVDAGSAFCRRSHWLSARGAHGSRRELPVWFGLTGYLAYTYTGAAFGYRFNPHRLPDRSSSHSPLSTGWSSALGEPVRHVLQHGRTLLAMLTSSSRHTARRRKASDDCSGYLGGGEGPAIQNSGPIAGELFRFESHLRQPSRARGSEAPRGSRRIIARIHPDGAPMRNLALDNEFAVGSAGNGPRPDFHAAHG